MTSSTTMAPTRTPAPTGFEGLVDVPFARWASDATTVTIPLVPAARSEALEALLALSSSFVARIKAELDQDRRIRQLLAARESEATATAPAVQERHPGTIAVEQLSEWLDLPADSVLSIVALSPSTRQFWRNNPTAPVRRGKAGRLLRFRTAVGLLVGSLGVEQTRHMLHAGGWMQPLDEARLAALEARSRQQVASHPMTAPEGLTSLTTAQLLAATHPGRSETEQRLLESARDAPARQPTAEDGPG